MLFRRSYITYLIIVLTLLPSALSRAESAPVWKVTTPNTHIFIGGTVHLLAKDDYPLPSAFETAYQQSQVLVFETDIQQSKSPQFQQALLAKTMYTDGTVIGDKLAPNTQAALTQFLASRGLPLNRVERFKPGMLSIMLTVMELQRMGLANAGVDEFYSKKASQDNKPQLFLESIDEQLGFLEQMGKGQEDTFILHTLKDINQLPTMMTQLKSAWRGGDNQALIDVALIPWKNEFPDVYQSLLVKRNNAWMPRIEQMLTTAEVEYVLVGALHLVGDDGILTQLRAQGYQVEKLK